VSYRTVFADLLPTGLQDPYGQAWARAHGIVLDAMAQRARASVQQRLPGGAAADSLGAIGSERGIDLGLSLQRTDPPTYAIGAATTIAGGEAAPGVGAFPPPALGGFPTFRVRITADGLPGGTATYEVSIDDGATWSASMPVSGEETFPAGTGLQVNWETSTTYYIGDEWRWLIAPVADPAETLDDYAARVRQAWILWQFGGCPIGLLVAFAVQGYYPEIVCASGSPGLWGYGTWGSGVWGAGSNGAVYSVAPGAFGAGTWAAGTWADPAAVAAQLITTSTAALTTLPWNAFYVWFPTLPGSWTTPTTPPTPSTVPSVYEIRRLFAICVDRWKPAWTKCLFIGAQVFGSPGIWGAPSATWGMVGATWGSSVALYYPTD